MQRMPHLAKRSAEEVGGLSEQHQFGGKKSLVLSRLILGYVEIEQTRAQEGALSVAGKAA